MKSTLPEVRSVLFEADYPPWASRVSWRRRSSTPSGPLTETSASSRRALSSLERAADQEGGHALVTERGDRLERLEVAQVVAGEEEGAGRGLLDEGADDLTLVHAGRADLDHLAAGLDHQVVLRGQVGQHRQEYVERGGGVLQPPGVDGDRQPLVLDERVTGVVPTQDAGQPAEERREAVRGARGDDPAAGGGPALEAVLAEQVQLLAGAADGVADLVEARRGPAPDGPGGR